MSSQVEDILMCPICLDRMTKPIMLCKNGHNMCGDCLKGIAVPRCPICRGELSNTRNYQLEQIIEQFEKCLKLPCTYSKTGCKFVLAQNERQDHEDECKFRNFSCEGKKFAKWECSWHGELANLYKHFQDNHNTNTWMQFRTEGTLTICLERDHLDIQIISYFNGQHLFYYKHKVDVAKAKAYWTFQLIGTKNQAKNYYYEFEIHKGPIRKFKVTEICENDTVNANDIFDRENCVVMSFSSVKSYLNENGKLPFKFRLLSIKKSTGPPN